MLRRQTTIHREGWYYLLIVAVVFGGALFKEVNLLLILAGMLLGPVLLNWQAVGTNLRRTARGTQTAARALRRRLVVGRSPPQQRPATARRLGRGGRGTDSAGDGRGREQSSRSAAVPRGAFPLRARGRISQGRLSWPVAGAGPLSVRPLAAFHAVSLWAVFADDHDGRERDALVLPRLGRLTEGWAGRRLEAFAGVDRRSFRPGLEGDFYGVREWRGGDSRRLIHWRSSARLGKLVVRQFAQPRSRDVAIVLELWQPERPTADQLANVELAVSFAATVLADVCRKGGSSVYLAMSNPTPECLGAPASAALLQGLMEQLATVEAGTGDTLPTLLANALPRIAAGAEIVLVSTRPVNLADAGRFAAVWSNPVLRERAQRIRCIDTSSEQLAEFFQAEA